MARESLAAVLTRALDEVSRRVEEITGPEGLSLAQWLVLHGLAVHGPRAMRELVAETCLDDSTLTRVVDRLTTLGLVYREADPSDRRRVLVTAGARGAALHDRLAPAVEEAERELLASGALSVLGRPARPRAEA
ncbi:MarR family transcriptional regulator [Actinomycetospora cinnamomea]|uniref:DNA-binding MarR family transcriptional regulator n=1 Tax=Actinomycetospora cinnamomea TaxID=663609 RepID=A0A2U1EXF2_9PSEU|nr:MarR family transcriptional regulator [Actinomycetospora cinnamomea]PVZ04602.1 DNA-binding MarR family transcriptional regulator [Actinomycetospora cinnamomea]